MKSIPLNDPINLDDLVRAYVRFRDWMDYDAERSAYSAKEIITMQQLFKTAYVVIPRALRNATYEELATIMQHRQALLASFTEEIYNPGSEGVFDDLRLEIDKSTFRTTVHYFTTLHEAIWQAADSITFDDESAPENYSIDSEPFDEHFDEVDEATFDDIRAFIISEHPGIEQVTFPVENAYALGLPRQIPDPIDHGPPGDLVKQ
jgi:hypothetical protein